jgi:hypothetical protein
MAKPTGLLMQMGGVPAHEIAKILQSNVSVFVDDTSIRHEEVRATAGTVDLVIYDASTTDIQNTFVYGFDPREDYAIFRNMDGQALYLNGEPAVTVATPAPPDGGTPYGFVAFSGTPYTAAWLNSEALLPFHAFDIHFQGTMIG